MTMKNAVGKRGNQTKREKWAVSQVSIEIGQAEPSIHIYVSTFIQ